MDLQMLIKEKNAEAEARARKYKEEAEKSRAEAERLRVETRKANEKKYCTMGCTGSLRPEFDEAAGMRTDSEKYEKIYLLSFDRNDDAWADSFGE